MFSLRTTFTAAITLAAAALTAQTPAAGKAASAASHEVNHAAHHAAVSATRLPHITYQKYTLPNGLTVITHEDHRLPLVAVDLWYHVGPLNELPGRTGFAHLFEHMMFEGSEHVGEKAHIKDVEAAGATDVNGTTDFDRTNYFETMPANQLELALWLESDRMGFLMEGLNRTLLANQRDVVRNERRQGEGEPYDLAEDAEYHLLFPQGHPYYGDVMGSHADIEAARITEIRDFHQHFYIPNNASIAIAGDFNPVQLRALLTKYFGPIPKGPDVAPVSVATPPITSQRRATVTDTVQLSQVKLAWLLPAAFTLDSYAADIAMYALGEAKVSRLDKALVYDKPMAQTVFCEVNPLKLVTIADCSITAKPGVSLEDIEATAWDVIAKFQAEGPTADEVKAAKATELSHTIVGLQRLGGFGGVADTLDRYNQYTGDPGYLTKDVAATEHVSVDDAKNAVAKYFTKDAAVVVDTVPGKKVLNDVPRSPDNTDADVQITNPYSPVFEASQAWRKHMPKPGPPVQIHLPVPATFALDNGLKVYVVEDHTLPVLAASLVTRAGGEANPEKKSGLANLTASTMGEATTTLDVEHLSSAEELIGTTVSTQATMDSASATMTVLSTHTQPAMALLSDVVEHPAFSESDFDRVKKRTLVGIQQSSDNVFQMALRAGPKLVFGPSPYGTPLNGTLDSVKSLHRDEADGFYKTHVGPGDSALVLVGDVTRQQARVLAKKYFGAWTGTASNAVTLPPAPTQKTTYIALIDKPGAPQTALAALGVGVPASSPDLPKLQVANYILGGSFGSRINMNLREVHGYTYGANSFFRTYRAGGMFFAGGLIRTDATAAAAKEMMGEITRFPTNPPTDAELKAAKDAEIQSLPGDFATTESIAGALRGIFLYNRPLNYYATLPGKYRAVTATDVESVAKEDLHPGQLVIVAAGDRTQIEQPLKETNLGKVVLYDLNGDKIPTDNDQ
jgi:zinc protease